MKNRPLKTALIITLLIAAAFVCWRAGGALWTYGIGLVLGIGAAQIFYALRSTRSAPRAHVPEPGTGPLDNPLPRALEKAVSNESASVDASVLGAQYRHKQRLGFEQIIDSILDDFIKVIRAHLDVHTAAVFFPSVDGGFRLRRFSSRSEHINANAVIYPGVGVIGGFIKDGLRQLNLQEIVSDSMTLYYYTRDAGIRSLMASPIVADGIERGTIIVDSTEKKHFSDEDHAYLAAIASMLGRTVYYTYLHNEHRLSHLRLVSMSSIEKDFFLHLDLDSVLNKMIEIIPFALSCDRLSISLRHESGNKAMVHRAWGEQTDGLEGTVFSFDEKSLSALVYTKNISFFRNYSADHYEYRYHPDEPPCREMASFLAVPFGVEKCIGTILVESRRSDAFTETLRELLSRLATSAGLAIEKIEVLEQAQALATHDGLTGLINHRHFQSLLKDEAGRARRYGEPLSFALGDIDFFKKLNDSYGHPFGDVVLQGVSALLQESVRDRIDIAARYGGEEFALVFVKADTDQASDRLEKIRSQIESMVFRTDQGTEVKVTMSFGLSSLSESIKTTDALIKRADKALYRAKENGRNRVEILL